MGRMLRRDFEKFGVHLPERGQARLAQLTAAALRLGMKFGTRPFARPSSTRDC